MTMITHDRLQTLLESAGKCRVAVLGDLMLDVYISGSASRLSQEAPVPVLRVKGKNTRLGGAANVMRNLTSLAPSCKVFAYGVTGDDEQGKLLIRLLEEGGIDASGVEAIQGRPTTEKMRVIAGNQQLVRMDFEETSNVPVKHLEQMAEKLIEQIENGLIDAIIFEDYAKGLIVKDVMQKIVECAVRHNVFTSLDPHPGRPLEVKNISLMTPNRQEAFGLAGLYCSDPADSVEKDMNLKAVASKVIERWNPEKLLVTLGHQGMALFDGKDNDDLLVIPTVAREVFDVSGAGDTVIATYTLMSAAGATPAEAAFIANQAAGIVVGKAGTAVTNGEELMASFK